MGVLQEGVATTKVLLRATSGQPAAGGDLVAVVVVATVLARALLPPVFAARDPAQQRARPLHIAFPLPEPSMPRPLCASLLLLALAACQAAPTAEPPARDGAP